MIGIYCHSWNGFPGSSAGKESICNAGDLGSVPGFRRSPGGRHGNPLLCSCLGNSQPTEEPGSYGPSGYKTLDTTATSTHTWEGKGREGTRGRVGHSFLPGIFLLSIYAHEFLRQFGQKDSLTKAVELVFVKFLIWDLLSVSCAHVVQWLSCV